MTQRLREHGAAAIFIVMFASLLFLVITVSFIRIMVQEQARSNDNELSQSAYDAALAGVEDGKRVLSLCDADANPLSPVCAIIARQECNTTQAALRIGSAQEVLLKTQVARDNASSFDQAYTCVKISPDTDTIEGVMPDRTPELVQLKAVAPYNQVEISWFSKRNLDNKTLAYGAVGSKALPELNKWDPAAGTARPPLIKTIYIPDVSGDTHETVDKTIYLFPAKKTALTPPLIDVNQDDRRHTSITNNPVYAPVCVSTMGISNYACSARLKLPSNVTNAYLYLASMYGESDYRLMLYNSAGSIVKFDGVQPQIDATGRAGDIYRRVGARVERVNPDASSLYPRATIDILNNFCKTFTVGTIAEIYNASLEDGGCDPTKAG